MALDGPEQVWWRRRPGGNRGWMRTGVIRGGPPAGERGSGGSGLDGPIWIGPGSAVSAPPGGSGQGRERMTQWKRNERSDGSGNGPIRESQETGHPFFLLAPPVGITPRVWVAPESVQSAPVYIVSWSSCKSYEVGGILILPLVQSWGNEGFWRIGGFRTQILNLQGPSGKWLYALDG